MERLQPADDRALRRLVDSHGLVAALAGPDRPLALGSGRQLGEAPLDVRGCDATEVEPRSHSSNGEKRRPLASLGKKYVDFSGIVLPARAICWTSSTVGARTRNAAARTAGRDGALGLGDGRGEGHALEREPVYRRDVEPLERLGGRV